jgi:hypothetical protein
MGIFDYFISFFKKEESIEYPRDFAVVMLTDIAKKNNINDDFNKRIFRYKAGKLFKVYNYSEENVKNIRKIFEIPIIEEKLNGDYKFQEGVIYGQVQN